MNLWSHCIIMNEFLGKWQSKDHNSKTKEEKFSSPTGIWTMSDGTSLPQHQLYDIIFLSGGKKWNITHKDVYNFAGVSRVRNSIEWVPYLRFWLTVEKQRTSFWQLWHILNLVQNKGGNWCCFYICTIVSGNKI